MVLVRCYGVPLSAWDRKVFEEIGSRVGKVVEVARETLDKSVLQFGRMRLQVEQFRDVYTVLHLNSFGYSYPVSVREEV